MFHSFDFISCRVSTVFASGDADGDIIRKFRHKVFPRVSQLNVVDYQGEWGRAKDSMPLLMSTNSVVVPSTMTLCFCDSKSQGSS